MELKKILNAYFSETQHEDSEIIWVIFGAGKRGQRLLYMLKNNNIEVKCFCDNDIKKQGSAICDTPVVGIEQLIENKDNYHILVSPYKGWEIATSLEEKGFIYVLTPDVVELIVYWENMRCSADKLNFFPYGHFYSLYPDLEEIKNKEELIFFKEKDIRDIDFNEETQIEILYKMSLLYNSIPQWEDITASAGTSMLRYRYNNPNLSPGDTIGLHCMLRILAPKRVIEVGSGYTSAVMLDTNEFYLNNQVKFKFIEPYPSLLKTLLKPNDEIELLPVGLQDVSLSVFEELEEGDILFIDSTHVSKVGSDVNYLFFDIFPRLAHGVYIHLHDIFYPFEYPKEWIFSGKIWNELYLLRAFLQNNNNYKILFFQNMMEKRHKDKFLEGWPLDAPIHGGSIWLQKK
ncbi:hypothetical protein FYJ38_17580 [Clostridium sp. WB02_MRS01]|uniref:hypothetical protein n=1 Tax=Clostridium sp. WB02_MRS01 TaxID=2605777 RepID=UPI0012B2BD36|nr:hypothetical protein [Clostridium sp. WB02_MRS01]MSS10447.1 hypothetical protein [Clostridium sp. WB02_MRS01]